MTDKTISKDEFIQYVQAFNSHDFKRQYAFYHDDVILDIPDPQPGLLHGKEGIRKHYLHLFSEADEVIVPMVVAVDGNNIFYIMESYFRYRVKKDEGVFAYPVEPGDVVKIRVWAHYIVSEGKMKTIVCNLFKAHLLGKANLAEAIAESRSRADPELQRIPIGWEQSQE
ncbi:hypothetical protein NW757_014143 [Fusarium falciforme]|nr:hypothetical protein NW757_014143 [Fusarium falciforme]